MLGETVLTVLLYVAAGWIALLGVNKLQAWRQTRRRVDLMTGVIYALAATVSIAYLIWWPLLLALIWWWLAPLIHRE